MDPPCAGVAGAIGFTDYKKKPKARAQVLEPEEKVCKALMKAKNHTMWQKELPVAVGFTKPKLSRTVRNIEQRGLVKRTAYGATNQITLASKE
ncbi:MAG: helix-turn-helix transcriptional regulator [Nanobdellota archaeon]